MTLPNAETCNTRVAYCCSQHASTCRPPHCPPWPFQVGSADFLSVFARKSLCVGDNIGCQSFSKSISGPLGVLAALSVGFIRYKAALAGVQGIEEDPRHTSRRRSRCGRWERGNRSRRAGFRCKACGCWVHADLNATRNLAAKRDMFLWRSRHDTSFYAGQGLVIRPAAVTATFHVGSRLFCWRRMSLFRQLQHSESKLLP